MKILRFIPVLALLFASATAGAEEPNRYTINVNEFHELKVINSVNVEYRCDPDSAGKVSFTASPELVSLFIFSNPKGTLEIRTTDTASTVKEIPTVTVYSSYLNKVENSGDSTVRVNSIAPGAEISATVIGNGRLIVHGIRATKVNGSVKTGNGLLVLSGECDNANFKFYGTGTIQADELKAQTVQVKASGTGSIGVWATEKLSVYGMGSSKIYYKGTPEIKKSSLGLKVEPLP
jgi:Protein of unknown function (DUF2807).